MNNLTVTVAIPAWNEEKCIGATIDSLLDQTYKVDIIVVDDASTDSTAEIARKKGVRVVTAPKQGSKSRALNYIIPTVETDLFICVDADTILAYDAVEHLVKSFDDIRVMVACGMVHSKSNENFWQASRATEYISMQKIVKAAQQRWKAILVASGCFFAVRTWYMKGKGGFPDRTLAEDMDLTWMAVEDGYEVSFVETARCWVDDPYNCYTYKNQVERWFRGYFQNIRVRNYGLFSSRKKLGVVVYGYTILNLISIPLFFIALFSGPLNLFYVVLLWIGIVGFFYYYYGNESLIRSYTSTFKFLICSFLNQYLFIKSAWLELVKGDELRVWIKGH